MKNFVYGVAFAAVAALGFSSCGNTIPSAKLNTEVDSVSYAFGVINGAGFSQVTEENRVFPETTLEFDQVLAGFIAAAKQDSSVLKMTQEEANEYCNKYFQAMQQKADAKRQAELAENKAKGADFMAENGKAEGVETLESGLQIQHLVVGKGKQPVAGETVKVNYKGMLIDGTVFDQNDGIDFPVNGVVAGFKEGLCNMKEGGKAILTMPSNLAYGDRGAGANIPGGATLQFEVTLLEVVKK